MCYADWQVSLIQSPSFSFCQRGKSFLSILSWFKSVSVDSSILPCHSYQYSFSTGDYARKIPFFKKASILLGNTAVRQLDYRPPFPLYQWPFLSKHLPGQNICYYAGNIRCDTRACVDVFGDLSQSMLYLWKDVTPVARRLAFKNVNWTERAPLFSSFHQYQGIIGVIKIISNPIHPPDIVHIDFSTSILFVRFVFHLNNSLFLPPFMRSGFRAAVQSKSHSKKPNSLQRFLAEITLTPFLIMRNNLLHWAPVLQFQLKR